MRRVLFTLPIGDGMPVFGYGLFLMLGFVVALLIAIRRAKKRNLPDNAAMDVGLISIFAGVIGARVAYLLIDYEPMDGNYGNWAEWLAVWQGGLTFQGGLILALIADWIYLRARKTSVARMFDAYAPALAVGVGFGRLGCLMNGCCWGKIAPAWFPLGMTFPPEIEPMQYQYELMELWPEYWAELTAGLGYPAGAMPYLPLYPTQLASAIGLFLIGALLVWMERRRTDRPDGQVIVWFINIYSIARFAVEFFREDTPLRYGFGAFEGFKLGQWLALAMLAAGIALHVHINRKYKAQKAVQKADSP